MAGEVLPYRESTTRLLETARMLFFDEADGIVASLFIVSSDPLC